MKKREVKNLHSSNQDFKYFCKKITMESLTQNLVVLGENDDTKNFLLDDGVFLHFLAFF